MLPNKFSLLCRQEVFENSLSNDYLRKTLDSTFKGAVFSYHSIVSYKNVLNRKNFTYNILDEAFITNQIVFYFTKNFFLIDEINEKIIQFQENGLINYWMAKYIDQGDATASVLRRISSALTFKHLNGTFKLLIYGLMLSLIAFVAELTAALIESFKSKS